MELEIKRTWKPDSEIVEKTAVGVQPSVKWPRESTSDLAQTRQPPMDTSWRHSERRLSRSLSVLVPTSVVLGLIIWRLFRLAHQVSTLDRLMRRRPVVSLPAPRGTTSAWAAQDDAEKKQQDGGFSCRRALPVSVFNDQAAWRTGCASAIGGRAENEDAVLVRTVLRQSDSCFEVFDLAALADGLGGRPGGATAARIAAEAAMHSLIDQVGSGADVDESCIRRAFYSAAEAVAQEARQRDFGEGFCTTLVVAQVDRCTRRGTVAAIGDSEALLQRSDLRVKRCVTPQRGRQSHQVAACLGPRQVGRPQIVPVQLGPGDVLILATDGLVQPDEGRFTSEEMADAVTFQAHQCDGQLSEALQLLLRQIEACEFRDVVGNLVFDDNQSVCVIGTGVPLPCPSYCDQVVQQV